MMTYREWTQETFDDYCKRIYGCTSDYVDNWESANETYKRDTYERYKQWVGEDEREIINNVHHYRGWVIDVCKNYYGVWCDDQYCKFDTEEEAEEFIDTKFEN